MIKIIQFIAVFLELGTACFILYALLLLVIEFFQQLHIRMRCKYRGFREKPGRACVICKDQEDCNRACKSREYAEYFFCRISHPDQAREMFDEIRAEEKAKAASSK